MSTTLKLHSNFWEINNVRYPYDKVLKKMTHVLSVINDSIIHSPNQFYSTPN